MSTLSIYKIVIGLTSQILSREGGRQTDMQSDFVARAQSPWNTGQTRSPSELAGWSKVTTTYFLCVDQFGLFLTWGCLCLKKLCFKPRQWRILYRSLVRGNIPL